MENVSFDTWKTLDLRVAEVKNVEDHPNADKLYVLTVDIGDEERTVVAGIKPFYPKEELMGRKIVIFTNLEPVVLRGVKSEGMLIAADQNGEAQLLQPDKDVAAGTKIR